jgi:hypothetical protein
VRWLGDSSALKDTDLCGQPTFTNLEVSEAGKMTLNGIVSVEKNGQILERGEGLSEQTDGYEPMKGLI